MTALLVLENISLDKYVRVSKKASKAQYNAMGEMIVNELGVQI